MFLVYPMGSSTKLTLLIPLPHRPPTPSITWCYWLWDKWFIYYDCIQIVLSTFAATWIFTEISYLYICFHCSFQFSSVAHWCPILCGPVNCSTQGLSVHHQLPESTQTHVHWVSDAIQPSHPMSSPSPPTLNLSQHQCLFQWVSSLHQVAKVLEFELQHQSFQWTPELISFRMDWLDLLAVQGTLKSLLQHHSSKASILQWSAFFMVQLASIHDHWKNP